ncbi:MAG: methionine adenosyltransferase [Eubacteriales bacterium]|nr:methionine adenosyltransferase [Eubacteriales bacterium]
MNRKNRGKWVFTSESVTEGHPDKICDQISDSVLDAILELDPNARVACETAVTTGMVLVMGEVTTNCYVDIQEIVRSKIKDIGYDRAKFGFDNETCAVLTSIHEQSLDIAVGVDNSREKKAGMDDSGYELGAGDQGMVFGYACSDTQEKMPLAISLAHGICRKLAEVRKTGKLRYLRPDGKAQVSVEYFDDKPVRVDTIVVSTQHDPRIGQDQIAEDIRKSVIENVIPEELMDENTRVYINPTGKFVTGGPQGDSGLTGRKIIVDTYGGFARHGGGAFSGKDPTKVDRSGAYAARYVAKNIVESGLADECEVQIAYAIGVAEPVSVYVNTFDTGKIEDSQITEIVRNVFDLKPASIIKDLDLRRPIYSRLASYGHFGRNDLELTWENTDKTEEILAAANQYLK